MRDTIDMAREAGLFTHKEVQAEIKAFEALVRADEREQSLRREKFIAERWAIECASQVEIEREACAKVCENDAWRCKKIAVETQDKKANAAALEAYLCAEAIRARSQS